MRSAVVALATLAPAHGFVAPCVRPAVAVPAVVMRMPWEPVEANPEPGAEDEPKEVKKGIDFSGLAQLVTMGAGAPMLGDLKKINWDQTEADGGAFAQFELEANNFEDENGNIKKGEFRDEGYVDPDYEDPMEALKKMWPFGNKD